MVDAFIGRIFDGVLGVVLPTMCSVTAVGFKTSWVIIQGIQDSMGVLRNKRSSIGHCVLFVRNACIQKAYLHWVNRTRDIGC